MTSSQLWRQPLFYLAAVCVAMGAYFRLRGLGVAPFAVDEYYLARSIEGVLRSAVPSFMCGGLYLRGLLLQYSSAALELAGASPEYAPRFICTLCSLLCLPAIFILGKRAKDPVVGLVAVILCALSVWEIEIARFGRMYAPFQAVFLWYTVFFLRYTLDGNKRAIWPMIALSVAGPLVWEGGGFLAVLNLVSLFLRRWPENMRRGDWIYLMSSIALLALIYAFLSLSDDFRFRGSPADSWPPGYSLTQSATPADHVAALKLPLAALRQHRGWLAAAVLPLLAALLAVRRIWQFRDRRSTATVLTATAALAGFALTEDFQPEHLLHIDSPQETFRLRMTPAMEEHLIIRTDYRAVADWLQQHKTDDTTVINGVHGLDHYYNGIDYFYVEENSANFPGWSCRKGTVERWGNYPLLYTTGALAVKVSAKPKAYLVAFSYDQDQTLASLAALHPRVAMATGDVIIIELRG